MHCMNESYIRRWYEIYAAIDQGRHLLHLLETAATWTSADARHRRARDHMRTSCWRNLPRKHDSADDRQLAGLRWEDQAGKVILDQARQGLAQVSLQRHCQGTRPSSGGNTVGGNSTSSGLVCSLNACRQWLVKQPSHDATLLQTQYCATLWFHVKMCLGSADSFNGYWTLA